MEKKAILFLALLIIALILISGYATITSRAIFHFQDNKTLDCTKAAGRNPILNSSGAVIGHYEIKMDMEDKCVAVETREDSITFSLKNKS